MRRFVVVIIAVIAVFGGVIWYGTNKNNNVSKVAGTTTQMSEFARVQQAVTDGAKLYDVRTAEEFAAGHFANAMNWPLQDMQSGKLPDVAKDTKIYVYCRSGNRSGQATTVLQQAGYTSVTDLKGLTNVESLGGKLVTN